jgi:hypothetical protein
VARKDQSERRVEVAEKVWGASSKRMIFVDLAR